MYLYNSRNKQMNQATLQTVKPIVFTRPANLKKWRNIGKICLHFCIIDRRSCGVFVTNDCFDVRLLILEEIPVLSYDTVRGSISTK